jgi:hypothetical protein
MFTLLLHHVYTLCFHRYATFKGGAAEFFFRSLSFYTQQFVGRVSGDTYCVWDNGVLQLVSKV